VIALFILKTNQSLKEFYEEQVIVFITPRTCIIGLIQWYFISQNYFSFNQV